MTLDLNLFKIILNSETGSNIIKMINSDLARKDLSDIDKMVLNYIKKRYIDCKYPLSPKKKYFLDINFININHSNMSNDELDQNIIIFKDNLDKYSRLSVTDSEFIKEVKGYICKQLKHKRINKNVAFNMYETMEGYRFIMLYYTPNLRPVTEINIHKLFRFFGLYPIRETEELFHYRTITEYTNVSILLEEEKDNTDKYKYIYQLYQFGTDVDTIANKYKLSKQETRAIISICLEKYEDRQNFMYELKRFLTLYYPKYIYRIYNSLDRHLFDYDIYKLEDIKDLINEDTYIRGIGNLYRGILKEFIKREYN